MGPAAARDLVEKRPLLIRERRHPPCRDLVEHPVHLIEEDPFVGRLAGLPFGLVLAGAGERARHDRERPRPSSGARRGASTSEAAGSLTISSLLAARAARGVRSSWLASSIIRCWTSEASWSRSSMALKLSVSASTSCDGSSDSFLLANWTYDDTATEDPALGWCSVLISRFQASYWAV